MREQLIQYVQLLFAGAPGSSEIQQEILQNTLDRYDDLIDQGKSPEAAYRLAISGIGDINEILGGTDSPASAHSEPLRSAVHAEAEDIRRRNMRAVAVALYILCPIPLFCLSESGLDTIGLCCTLILVAGATALMMVSRKEEEDPQPKKEAVYVSPRQELRKSVEKAIGALGLMVYLIVSFATEAWFFTWLIFPIVGCIKGLVNAIWDLKEANEYET